ncbi:MAG TPA: alanine dehydrogenase [Dehalococcoidia bacterium]|nr:alanine dehydrogenase [Dehalococcoidia bacterium]
MIIGVPREIKNYEYRVAMVPAGVRTLVSKGHRVLLERSAGDGSGISDEEYQLAGAEIKESVDEIFGEAEMVIKVKEPIHEEWPLLKEGQILFTYLHLAPALELTKALLERKVIGIAYETVQLPDGSLPLLEPMSEIAGKLSVQVGACYLQRENGGSGVLLGGVPGIRPGNVVIIGGGTVGTNAAKVALGMGASVTILDINIERLRYLADILSGRLITIASNKSNIEAVLADADLVVGATLIPGARAEKLVTREMLTKMRKGSVLVDVAVDQGGCCETSVPTNHDKPVFIVDDVLHYCVANIPSAVSRSSTFALTNATFPYILKLADMGYCEALRTDENLKKGLNVYKGKLVYAPVAKSLGLEYTSLDTL